MPDDAVWSFKKWSKLANGESTPERKWAYDKDETGWVLKQLKKDHGQLDWLCSDAAGLIEALLERIKELEAKLPEV